MEALLIVFSLLGLAGWWWLLRRTPGWLGDRVPVDGWRVTDAAFCGVVALFFIYQIFVDDGGVEKVTPEMVRAGFTIYAIIIFFVVIVAFAPGRSAWKLFGLKPASPLRVIGTGLAGIVLTYPILQLAGWALTKAGGQIDADDGMVQYLRGGVGAGEQALVGLLVVVAAPLAEELLFRGYFYGVTKKYAGRVWAMLATSLLFAAIHHNLVGLPVLFLFAVTLTLAYEHTGSLWAPITMHALFNFSTFATILWFPEWNP